MKCVTPSPTPRFTCHHRAQVSSCKLGCCSWGSAQFWFTSGHPSLRPLRPPSSSPPLSCCSEKLRSSAGVASDALAACSSLTLQSSVNFSNSALPTFGSQTVFWLRWRAGLRHTDFCFTDNEEFSHRAGTMTTLQQTDWLDVSWNQLLKPLTYWNLFHSRNDNVPQWVKVTYFCINVCTDTHKQKRAWSVIKSDPQDENNTKCLNKLRRAIVSLLEYYSGCSQLTISYELCGCN